MCHKLRAKTQRVRFAEGPPSDTEYACWLQQRSEHDRPVSSPKRQRNSSLEGFYGSPPKHARIDDVELASDPEALTILASLALSEDMARRVVSLDDHSPMTDPDSRAFLDSLDSLSEEDMKKLEDSIIG